VKFHSLRHNVEDALRNADVRQEVRDAIQGHGENGVSREYGTGYYVKTLNIALQKIIYDGLDLSHLTAKATHQDCDVEHRVRADLSRRSSPLPMPSVCRGQTEAKKEGCSLGRRRRTRAGSSFDRCSRLRRQS
jgi:hypothetical protein